jgi:hypothetical protein
LQFSNHRAAVEDLPVVLIAIDGEEHCWLDLFKTINDAARSEIREQIDQMAPI